MKKHIFSFLLIILVPIENSLKAQELLDFSGKKISACIVAGTLDRFKELQTNESVLVKTDNYSAIKQDLFAWSRMTGNVVAIKESSSQSLTLEITKKSDQLTRGKAFSIIVSDKGMLELLSPLGMSLVAAVSGYQVNIYFQGPAVKVLEKGFKGKLKGFNSIFSRFALNGLNQIGNPPAQEKLKTLEKYGARFYVCQPSMERFKLKEENIMFSNTVLCEYFTFLEVFEKSDIKFFMQ